MPDNPEHWTMWVTEILGVIAYAALFMMLGALIWAIIKWRQPARKRCLWLAFGSFLVLVSALAFAQWLVFHVYLPWWAAAREIDTAALTQVGQAAPDFAVTTTDGKEFRLKDLEGRVVLVNFFATWCGPCQIELPHLQSMWEEFSEKNDFRMIVIGREESPETVEKFKEEHRFGFPMASDSEGSVFKMYATENIPRTYLLDRSGVIVYQCHGFQEAEIARLRTLIRTELNKAR